MVFGGVQKFTLLDYPEKTACTLFTKGCNFRCPFCQNSSLIYSDNAEKSDDSVQMISASEIFEFLETRRGLLDGVCISGGEPLLHDELGKFTEEVKTMGFLVKLDTNRSKPDKLRKLIASGTIDYIAMDIKNTPEKYAQTAGLPDLNISLIEESVEILLLSTVPYEFRTTVVRELHSSADLVSIARWLSGAGNYYLQGFVNSDGVPQNGLHGYSDKEMNQFLDSVKKVLPSAELRGV